MTSASSILTDLLASGITPSVTSDGLGIVVPAGKLTRVQREAILAVDFRAILTPVFHPILTPPVGV